MRPTLLVIDDSPDIHALLEVRLKPENLRIEHAYGGAPGLAKAEEIRPDLILLDVDMPEVSGFDVCRRLKEDPATSAIPIVFLTGASDVATKVHGFDLGAVDYVTKPFEPAELRARVRAALRVKRYQDMLATRAAIDGLTGLSTRACFDERLAADFAQHRKSGRTLALVILDVDHFKSMNDRFGHPFGDRVLQGVGDVLQSVRSASEAAYRYGGEEFTLLMHDAPLERAVERAEEIRRRIASLSWPVGRETVAITASFGVACTSDGAPASAAALVEAADKALYAAKAAGRDRVVLAAAA